ncbi:MAG: autoinducer 2-degrading protein [Rhodothermales bacterium]|jgi:autoinducer 2-degrading protein
MLVVQVYISVKTGQEAAFIDATLKNCQNSIQEAGVARFDLIQQIDDPTNFMLTEIYRTADAPAAHKETAHYQEWRDTVANMMAEPRRSAKYVDLFADGL